LISTWSRLTRYSRLPPAQTICGRQPQGRSLNLGHGGLAGAHGERV